jgi:hypothetical protein
MVSTIEPESVLKIEFFSTRLEARLRELLSDLKMEFFSVATDPKIREPLSPLNNEACPVRLETTFPTEPVND